MRIGFTGHRPNRLHIGAERVRARLDETLEALSGNAHQDKTGAPIICISALAEGSDCLFAESALDHGLILEALLPMPVREYIGTFSDQSNMPRFHELLARASKRAELPGSRADSKAAYEALGHAIVQACDVLVAVWDGKPAAGRGGTPEVIEYALDHGRRVVWVNSDTDRPARQLRAIAPTLDAIPFHPNE